MYDQYHYVVLVVHSTNTQYYQLSVLVLLCSSKIVHSTTVLVHSTTQIVLHTYGAMPCSRRPVHVKWHKHNNNIHSTIILVHSGTQYCSTIVLVLLQYYVLQVQSTAEVVHSATCTTKVLCTTVLFTTMYQKYWNIVLDHSTYMCQNILLLELFWYIVLEHSTSSTMFQFQYIVLEGSTSSTMYQQYHVLVLVHVTRLNHINVPV